MISVRSEVQVLPGPPFLTRISGAVAQLGEHLLCKQGVVGSIPSGSTISGVERMESGHSHGNKFAAGFGLLPVLYDIVKRRFVRVPPSGGSSPGTLNPVHMMGCLTAPASRSREAGLFCQCCRRRHPRMMAGWALAMRMIKCLKGNWWMPWHAQAMKDVIRCDKLRGGANTL